MTIFLTKPGGSHSLDMNQFRAWVSEARGGGTVEPKPPAQKKPDIVLQIGRVLVSENVNDVHPEVRLAQGLLAAYSPAKPGAFDGVAGPPVGQDGARSPAAERTSSHRRGRRGNLAGVEGVD